MTQLYIANKNYSSWSLRGWLMVKQSGIEFDEVVIALDEPTTRETILRHSPSGAVRCRVERFRVAQPAHDERRVGHRARDDAELARGGWRRSFAMDNQFTIAMQLFPREVVVVLHHRCGLFTQCLCDTRMDLVVARRSEVAGQVHGEPVLHAFCAIE